MKRFSSFTLSYLFFKVTKFFVKISQFEFLVTTEQSIFVYKLFLSLNIPDVSLFFVETLQPPLKSHPSFPATPRLKTEVLSRPPFLKNWQEVKPPSKKKGGPCTLCSSSFFEKLAKSIAFFNAVSRKHFSGFFCPYLYIFLTCGWCYPGQSNTIGKLTTSHRWRSCMCNCRIM